MVALLKSLNVKWLLYYIITNIKTKLCSPCEKYYNKKTPTTYKYKKVISNLSKNSSIIVLKQNKGRGVVIMNHTKYLDKCYTIFRLKPVYQT